MHGKTLLNLGADLGMEWTNLTDWLTQIKIICFSSPSTDRSGPDMSRTWLVPKKLSSAEIWSVLRKCKVRTLLCCCQADKRCSRWDKSCPASVFCLLSCCQAQLYFVIIILCCQFKYQLNTAIKCVLNLTMFDKNDVMVMGLVDKSWSDPQCKWSISVRESQEEWRLDIS